VPRTRTRPRRKRGTGSSAGALGRKAPDIRWEWGPVSSRTEPASARGVFLERTRYPGSCDGCGNFIPAGSPALWRPGLQRLECQDCSG
jgi:hypothetical protein